MPYLMKERIVRDAQLFVPYLEINHGCWPYMGYALKTQRENMLTQAQAVQADVVWLQQQPHVDAAMLKQLDDVINTLVRDLSYYHSVHAPTTVRCAAREHVNMLCV